MDAVKPFYLLLICQGFYLGSVGQRWTFPSTITALIGSCVEIPCTYHPKGTSGPSSPVWYLYDKSGHSEILNTKASYAVLENYEDRTSLVPGQDCTLRIDPVTREDGNKYYYPGIAENRYINADRIYARTVYLYVTDKVDILILGSKVMTEGEATIIQCIVVHTCGSSPPSLQWNKPGQVKNISEEYFDGSWRKESQLTYIPSYVDDESPVECTATYPNGQETKQSAALYINHAAAGVHITVKNKGGFKTLTCDFLSSRPNVSHYTWMQDGSILHNKTGKTLTLHNNDTYGRYSCIVHNRAGDSSSEEIYHKGEEPKDQRNYTNIILPASIGTICLLLLALLVYACWRKRQKKQHKAKKSSTETEEIYTDLRRSEIRDIYHELKPVTSADTTVVRSPIGATQEYENIRRPNF
ncbi:myelin-associated glycoprotein-like [Hyla sarda]|uniref:myelin-associated glycoprotein-like n=1 Tax=Hyla sarda TaxID=327740 RepID=UPI0024C2BE3B|nr:myelin-associated glycoprotein-like [Hyla sarda]